MPQLRKKYFDLIAGQPRPGGRLLRFFLRAASLPYSLVVRIRNWKFKLLGGGTKVGVPVVSVGNLTTGGTGKTPVVALIVEHLAGQSLHPGIISRGYQSISDDNGESGNDEKRVLKTLCPEAPHVQNADRIAAARECVSRFQAQILVADDGFQHRRLARDLDIVLVDALCPWGHGYLLPRGLLREPVSGLSRANLVILTRANEVSADRREKIWAEVHRHSSLPGEVEINFEPDELIDLAGNRSPVSGGTADSIGEGGSPQAVAFCGIGNPDGFRRTLAAAGFDIVDLFEFPDHHHYSRDDLVPIADRAQAENCGLVTTLKDLVKIQTGDLPADVSLRALNVRARITRGAELLEAELSKVASLARKQPESA